MEMRSRLCNMGNTIAIRDYCSAYLCLQTDLQGKPQKEKGMCLGRGFPPMAALVSYGRALACIILVNNFIQIM
jgi:hypothetical protein